MCVITMVNLPFASYSADMANVTTVHAARDKYVLMKARCCSSPAAPPPLKLGQYIHRNIVPENIQLLEHENIVI